MNQVDAFRVIVGAMILISVLLTYLVSPWWLLMTVFIGLNLVQSGFTRFCLLSDILARTKLPRDRSAAGGAH